MEMTATCTLQVLWNGSLEHKGGTLKSFSFQTATQETKQFPFTDDGPDRFTTLFHEILPLALVESFSFCFCTNQNHSLPLKIPFPPLVKDHVYKLYILNENKDLVGTVRDTASLPSYDTALRLSKMSKPLLKLTLMFSIEDLKKLENDCLTKKNTPFLGTLIDANRISWLAIIKSEIRKALRENNIEGAISYVEAIRDPCARSYCHLFLIYSLIHHKLYETAKQQILAFPINADGREGVVQAYQMATGKKIDSHTCTLL